MNKMSVKYARNMSGVERKSCYPMSYGSQGDLVYWLHDAVKHKNDDRVILYRVDDRIAGWAIVRSNGIAGFWVRTDMRRRGIGKKLASKAKTLHPHIKVFPHDVASIALFKSTGLVKPDFGDWRD